MRSVLISIGIFLMGLPFCQVSAAAAGSVNVPTDKGEYALYSTSEALIIANSVYSEKDEWVALTDVPRQAESIQKALSEQGFSTKIIENASLDTLTKSIRNFVVQNRPLDSRIVIYFAGHGWTNGKSDGFLVPVDAPSTTDENIAVHLLAMPDIISWSYQSSSKHVLFVFDSCFSGLALVTRRNLRPAELFMRDVDNRTRQFITSGSESEQVPAGSKFADAFIAGIKGDADIVPDGVISGGELGYWLKANISAEGEQTPQFGTAPRSEYRRGDFIFIPPAGKRPPFVKSSLSSDPTTTRSKRAAEIRALGTPADPRGSRFEGVEVRYSFKSADNERVAKALDDAGVPYTVNTTYSGGHRSNVLVCGKGTTAPALRELAKVLILRNIDVYGIFPWPTLPGNFVMVAGDNPKRVAGKRPLALDDVDEISGCDAIFTKNAQ